MYSILFILLMMLTVPVTVALCRFRLVRRLRVSYGTVAVSACIVAVFWFGCFFPFEFSYNSHQDNQHKFDPDWLPHLLRLTAFIAAICLVPALGVVAWYQRRSSDNHSPSNQYLSNQ